MRPRSVYLILCAFLCTFLLFPGSAGAQADDPVSLKAEAGFGGYARWGQAFPLQVTVENKGTEIKGRLQLTTSINDSRVLLNQEIQLPRGSRKRVTMYVPAGESTSYLLELLAGGKKIASAQARITILQPQEVLVGVLSSDPAALNHLASVKLPGAGQRVSVIHLEAEDIPENCILLDSLDILACNNFSTSTLSGEQMASIQSWTEGGGMLVLAGGANWQKTMNGIPAELLPVKITGSRQSTGNIGSLDKIAGQGLPSSSSFIVSEGQLQSGKVLAYDGAAPLLVEKQKGKGTVLYLGYDLAMQPFADWNGNAALWQNLITRIDPHHIISAGTAKAQMRRSPQEMSWVLRNFPASDLPSTAMLAGVLLIYLIILGPGVYLLLKKYDRRDWGWVAIPVLALLMFGFTYWGAFKARGRDVYTNVISLLRLDNDCDYARLSSYIGVFAPTKKDYFLSLPGDGLVSVLPAQGGGMTIRVIASSPGGSSAQLPLLATVQQGAGSGVSFNDASRWSLRCILAEESITRPGKIESDLASGNGRISGTIKNLTGRVLYDCVVFNRYGYQRIARMAPGETAQVDFLSRFSPARGPAIQRIFERYPVHRPQDNMNINARDNRINQQVLEVAANDQYLSDDSLMFFANSPEAVKEVVDNKDQGMSYYNTIIVSALQIKLNDGDKISIPPGIINGRFLGVEGNSFYQDNWGYSVDNGNITFQLDLPYSPDQLKVDELKIYTGSNDYRRAGFMKIKIYNYTQAQWEERAYQPSGIPLENWKTYVSDEGAIKVQIGSGDGQGQTNINVSGVTLSLEGSSPLLSERPVNGETPEDGMKGGE